MKCVICGNECNGVTCSAKCRKAKSRLSVTSGVTNVGVTSKCDIPVRTRVGGCSVAVPGDEDYEGVCQKIDGVWQVVKPEPIEPKDMTREQLYQAIKAYPHDQWSGTPEYRELMKRLITMTAEELKEQGYWIPAWKRSA